MKSAPRLFLIGSLWTLEGYPRPKREWTLARKIQAVADAGFAGITANSLPKFGRLLENYRLRYVGFFAAKKPGDFDAAIREQKAVGAESINVQIGTGVTTAREALSMACALVRAASSQGVRVAFEVHRNTATETPEKLRELSDGFEREMGKRLPLTWDHSHPGVVKHVKPFLFSDVLLADREAVQAAWLFHCRPFNGQHAQVPVFDARHRLTPEFRDWLRFVEDLFRCWLEGPRPGNEMCVCPEIGPVGVHGYNLSTMPPSWEQAVVCRRELVAVWRRLGGDVAARE